VEGIAVAYHIRYNLLPRIHQRPRPGVRRNAQVHVCRGTALPVGHRVPTDLPLRTRRGGGRWRRPLRLVHRVAERGRVRVLSVACDIVAHVNARGVAKVLIGVRALVRDDCPRCLPRLSWAVLR
jgi:hypothetical protein